MLASITSARVTISAAGRVKAHVNPDLDTLPAHYYDPAQMRCVKDFLQFYTFQAPILCFTTFWSDLPSGTEEELHLRGSGEHTHFWQEEGASFSSGVGGHYHGDLSPEEVHLSCDHMTP